MFVVTDRLLLMILEHWVIRIVEKGSSTSDSGSRTKRYSNNNKSIPMIRGAKLELRQSSLGDSVQLWKVC